MTDKFESAVLALAAGDVDVDVWRAVARANPPTFHVWANRYEELQSEEIISAAWYDPSFRDKYNVRRHIARNIEKFHENFTSKDFTQPESLKPFVRRKAAESMVAFITNYRYSAPVDDPQLLRLASNFEDLQVEVLKHAGNSYKFDHTDVTVSPAVATAYIESTNFRSRMVSWLLRTHTMEEIRSWKPRKVQDPIMGYIFGGPGIIKKLDEHEEFRHLGYLSILNVGDDDWLRSFKLWWTRHGQFDEKLMGHFADIPLVRDLDDLGDEFFTDRRLAILEKLLEQADGLKLRVPFVISIKFKELFLCADEEEFRNLKRAIVDGIKAFGSA